MRLSKITLGTVALAALFLAGCAGPEKKFGRGMSNSLEFVRMGEIRRSVEQSALWDGPEVAYTTGFIHGLNKSIVRTLVGFYEMVTFPIPSYDPVLTHYLEPTTVYPDNYRPNWISASLFDNDTNLGFSGGDILPVSGSRFHIFDN